MRSTMRAVALTSLLAVASAGSSNLSRRQAIGKSGHRGSSITQDGQTDILEGASGGASYQYVAGECYDESLNPVTFYAKDGKAWIQNNQNSTNWGGNNAGQNNVNPKYRHINWYYDIYDAYYNGSVSLKLTPPPGAPCEKVETQAVPYSYFRIGQMSRPDGKYSRKDYDNNPYYFRIGRSNGAEGYCDYTPKKMFTSLESSNNGYDHTQVWTVKSAKDGQKFNISGNINTAYANENNYFNVLPHASSNTTREETCPSHFHAATMNKDFKVTMNGIVDEKHAVINWYFVDQDSGWNVTGTFNGTWWDGGAKLDLSSSDSLPATSGEADRVKCENCDDDESFVEKHEKKIIGGAVVGGVVILAALGVGAWFFWSWWRKRHYQGAKQIDDHDGAWALEDHHDERRMKAGGSTALTAADTAYEPHRGHSLDHGMAQGFEYKDSYTPLK